ncbi:MAG: methyltransferase domain-containing protein [Lentisphaerota bacterium]
MKINIGSGSKRYPDYINIDSDSGSNPDYVVDIEKDPLPFADDTVDAVLAHHILEHLGDGFFNCIQELYRVCKHGTIIDVRVPHPRHDTFLIDPTHSRPIYPHTLDMFSKTRNKRDLDAGGCETPLGFIYNVDLVVVDHNFILDEYWQKQFQNFSEEQCEHAARSFNNVILEIGIKLLVNKDESIINR